MGPKIVNLDDTRGDTDHKATTCRKAMSISNKVYIKWLKIKIKWFLHTSISASLSSFATKSIGSVCLYSCSIQSKHMWKVFGLVPYNSIVWCYVWHYVCHYVINNKVVLLSKIIVTWIFEYYHIILEMHGMWFMWFNHRRYQLQVICKFRTLIRSRWWN